MISPMQMPFPVAKMRPPKARGSVAAAQAASRGRQPARLASPPRGRGRGGGDKGGGDKGGGHDKGNRGDSGDRGDRGDRGNLGDSGNRGVNQGETKCV